MIEYTFHNIPLELRERIQWLVWRAEAPFGGKLTKIPYNARHPELKASTTDRGTWSSFEQAVAALEASAGHLHGIGYVFDKKDPYCGIDFDDVGDDREALTRQKSMAVALGSYTELSPSGTGVHVLVKASVPRGRKRSFIEIYSEGRYFTMTGASLNADFIRSDEDIKPIVDRQALVTSIWEELGGGEVENDVYFQGDTFPKQQDDAVYEAAKSASNGDLFERLWNGDWSGYPSNQAGTGSSEADLALIDIIAYYSNNRQQIQRMFETSALGRRDKYAGASDNRRAYLIGLMITKSFDMKLPDVDISRIMDSLQAAWTVPSSEQASAASIPSSRNEDAPRGGGILADDPPPPSLSPSDFNHTPPNPNFFEGYDVTLWEREPPRGLLGQISKFIWDQSTRQIYHTALVGGLGLMSGIFGRSYNINGLGLSQYIMFLAPTGTGKESIKSGITALINMVVSHGGMGVRGDAVAGHPSARQVIGPSDIASGQALMKYLNERADDNPCFVSIVGEVGLQFQKMMHVNANPTDVTLMRTFLDLFSKSGRTKSTEPMIYSDKANNTGVVRAPAFSMIGETVPNTFYNAFDESAITSGLLPRFIIIEYTGPRVLDNENAGLVVPTIELVKELSHAIQGCQMRVKPEDFIDITVTPEAKEFLRGVFLYQHKKMNSANSMDEVTLNLWSRVHEKTLKLSGILALSDNWREPIVTLYNAQWAASLIIQDALRLLHKFKKGEIGIKDEATDQENVIRNTFLKYFKTVAHELPGVRSDVHGAGFIPYSFILNYSKNYQPFKKAKFGATSAVVAVLQTLVDKGHITDWSKDRKTLQRFGLTSAKLYSLTEDNWLM